jgi:hypothetical protein
MSGYLILPRQALDLYDGPVPTAREQIAFLDFLREIEQDPFPFAPRAQLCITGLDELLVALGCTDKRASAKELTLLGDYKLRLKRVAVEIGQLSDIQIPIAHELSLGGENRLSARHTPQDLVPLWRIFGHNPTSRGEVAPRQVGYHFGENLS